MREIVFQARTEQSGWQFHPKNLRMIVQRLHTAFLTPDVPALPVHTAVAATARAIH
jgi:hypothetical protein